MSMSSSRCVGEAKGHDQIYKVTKRCIEGHLPLVLLTDAHQIISIT